MKKLKKKQTKTKQNLTIIKVLFFQKMWILVSNDYGEEQIKAKYQDVF